MHARWKRTQGEPVRDDFVALLNNDLAYIKVADFVGADERERLLAALLRRGLRPYDFDFDGANVPPVSHLFEVHYLWEQRDPAEYLPRARASREEYGRVCAETGSDPARAVYDRIGGAVGAAVQIARQDGEEYNHVIVREVSAGSLLHTDFAPMIPARWSITVNTPACKAATEARPCCCFTPRRMSCITARASRPAMAASSGAS